MLLTEEKAKVISEYLVADKERAQRLLETAPEDAAKEMSADGCTVTAEELVEFGSAMAQVVGKAELSEDDLENVSGGAVGSVLLACGIAAVVGYGVGRLEKW